MIADGLLPRFTFIEYKGNRTQYNKGHSAVLPSDTLVSEISTLASTVLKFMQSGAVEHVKTSIDAENLLDEINAHADFMINQTTSDVTRHLWNRAHVKVMKLSALIAVGVNFMNPVITLDTVVWARNIIEHDILKLQARFENGEVGSSSEETKQVNHVSRIISDYIKCDVNAAIKYGTTSALHYNKIIPYRYVIMRLAAIAAFRLDRLGSTNAIKRTIQTMLDSGLIKEVGRKELMDKYETSQRAFVVSNLSLLGAEKV
jgi:hypothetical protein